MPDENAMQEEENLGRRTRGRKINYQEVMASDSEEVSFQTKKLCTYIVINFCLIEYISGIEKSPEENGRERRRVCRQRERGCERGC